LLCAALSFDDKYLITGGSDKTVRLWDAKDLKLIDTFKGHKDCVLVINLFGLNSHHIFRVLSSRVIHMNFVQQELIES